MLTIGQVASRAGLRASAIRYYEAQGLLPSPWRKGGKRMYAEPIIDRLAVIELAKMAGFHLEEIRAVVSSVGEGPPAAGWRKLVEAKHSELDAQIDALVRMKEVLAQVNACACATLEECGREMRRRRDEGGAEMRGAEMR